MTSFLHILWEETIHHLFPSLCLHCHERLLSHRDLFCSSCTELLSLISKTERCPNCFSEQSEGCCKSLSPLKKRAAAFEYYGPAATLIRALKFSDRPDLAKIVASFLTIQLIRLGWPLPDLLVPVPQSLPHYLTRGYNQSLLIAEEVGVLIERPVCNLLKRKSGDFSQTGRSLEQRKALPSDSFAWKNPCDISDKKILLIDDVLTSGTTLRHCASLLQEGFPSQIYALTFCMA